MSSCESCPETHEHPRFAVWEMAYGPHCPDGLPIRRLSPNEAPSGGLPCEGGCSDLLQLRKVEAAARHLRSQLYEPPKSYNQAKYDAEQALDKALSMADSPIPPLTVAEMIDPDIANAAALFRETNAPMSYNDAAYDAEHS